MPLVKPRRSHQMHLDLVFLIVVSCPRWVLGTKNVGPLEKQQALLTTEPSFLTEIKHLKEGGVDVAAEKAQLVKVDIVLAVHLCQHRSASPQCL